jgi:hypothetical protein
MTKTTEKADIRIEDHFAQAFNEEGERYHYAAGYVLQALVGGVHCFEFQGVFSTYEAAERKLNQICGAYSNGFSAMINTASGNNPSETGHEWQYIGSSR